MAQSRISRLLVLSMILFTLLACNSSTKVATQTSRPTEKIRTLAPTRTFAPILTPTAETVQVTVTKNTNCRSGPSTDYAIMLTLPAGTQVEVIGRNSGSDYYYIQDPDNPAQGCWIWSELATVTAGEIALLPVFTPAARPLPSVVPPTAAPACKVNSVIHINNKTGGMLTINLSGPAKFTFYVSTGNQSINVCDGTYSYSAYGCGGAVKTGTMSSGETHDFWCQ